MRLASMQSQQRRSTSLAARFYFLRRKNELGAIPGAFWRIDTVGVWGSNPHAPTIFLELIRYFRPPLVEAFRIWQTFGRLAIFTGFVVLGPVSFRQN